MSFKKNWNGIPKSLISPYKPNNPYNQPSVAYRTSDNPYLKNMLKNKKFDLQMRKGLQQPDFTPYSQGNVGGKK
jgi:hypothetical protein